MNQETENVIKAEARRCIDAIKTALRVKPKPTFDSVSKPLIKKHYEVVKPLGISIERFVSVMGRLNGRYGVDA